MTGPRSDTFHETGRTTDSVSRFCSSVHRMSGCECPEPLSVLDVSAPDLSAGVNFISSPSFASWLIFQSPAVHARGGRASEIAVRIFQMLVAQQNFRPLAAVLFEDSRARDENRPREFAARPRRCRFLRETIDDKQLLPPVLAQDRPGPGFPPACPGTHPRLPAPRPPDRRLPRPPFASRAQPAGRVASRQATARRPRTALPTTVRSLRHPHRQSAHYRLGNASVISTTRPVSRAHRTSMTCGTSDPAQSNW